MTIRWLEPALDDIRRLYDFLLDKDPAPPPGAPRARFAPAATGSWTPLKSAGRSPTAPVAASS